MTLMADFPARLRTLKPTPKVTVSSYLKFDIDVYTIAR